MSASMTMIGECMKVKVEKADALSALQESEIVYRLEQEGVREKYERQLEEHGVADIPPPDKSSKFELYRHMLTNHLETYVWLDEEAYVMIYRSKL